MPCRFASSGTVATSRSASRAILALNVASNFLRDLVISVLHRLRQSRTLHTLTFGPISGVHFNAHGDILLKKRLVPAPTLRIYRGQERISKKLERRRRYQMGAQSRGAPIQAPQDPHRPLKRAQNLTSIASSPIQAQTNPRGLLKIAGRPSFAGRWLGSMMIR